VIKKEGKLSFHLKSVISSGECDEVIGKTDLKEPKTLGEISEKLLP
jgi:hypothetical protein